MDFPAYELERVEITSEIVSAIGAEPTEVYKGRDLLCVFDDENIIKEIKPDMEKLRNIEGLLCHVTSKGNEYDCVSRSFAPKLNVNEDPVCGSGHCHIVPYWAKKLGKNNLVARQESKRGGVLYCEINGNRVKMAGQAVLYSQATIYIE
jgi:predicted PhzF superfamily epimerase YddE/YHI9